MGNTPKYVQIVEEIESDIRNGVYAPGDRLPTEKSLMQRYGVSRIVASTAFSNLVARGLIVRSQGKGSFVADSAGEGTAPRWAQKKTIAVVMPDIRSNYSIRLSEELVRAADAAGYFSAFYFTGNVKAAEEEILSALTNDRSEANRYAGLLLASCSSGEYGPALLALADSGLPTVLFDRSLPGLPLTCVQTDNRKAVRLATRYLINAGHRSIMLCLRSTGRVTSLFERIEGFLEEMSSHRILIDPSMIVRKINHPDQMDYLKKALLEHRATAVICLNSGSYLAVINGIRECGLRIPEDISVVTVDSLRGEVNDILCEPAHIEQNTQEIAALAVQKLLEQMKQGVPHTAATLLVEPDMVGGGTVCACHAADFQGQPVQGS